MHNEDKRICFVCSNMFSLKSFRAFGRGTKKYITNVCRSCENDTVINITDLKVASDIVRRVKYKSKERCLPFDLDIKWVLNRLNSISWKCELTGRLMIPCGIDKGVSCDSLSVDRIIPIKGYVKSNVRFITFQANACKLDDSDENMYMVAEDLLRNRKIDKV